ncbi:nucleoside 2-deoxyribosyltransferase [Pleurocapsales cyanobacterium LEGE 06147]|nr:nucleoside 2-deoxyribosyltransferase [Pleurocapsales cyanobacterium LEGE 06147]
MTDKKIYLASLYGFSQQQKMLLLPPIVRALEALGAQVWESFERNSQIDFSQTDWAYRVAQADLNDLKNCDGIFAVVNGTPPDEGVMIELGVAIALNKAIFLFRDDFRRCSDSERYPLNLMIFSGLPEVGWENYYYTSIKEIHSQDKALYGWLIADSYS